VSAQWVDHETLTRMISGGAGSRVAVSSPELPAAASRAGMRGVSTKDSLVGSWLETATFPEDFEPNPGGVLKSLVAFHDDGTMEANDQGSVNVTDEMVTSSGVGVWTQRERRRPPKFTYTQFNLFSNLNGKLVGFLKVRGIYTLSNSGNEYKGESFAEVFDTDGKTVLGSVTVINEGQRIAAEDPPPGVGD
jgi:hypothetical protein